MTSSDSDDVDVSGRHVSSSANAYDKENGDHNDDVNVCVGEGLQPGVVERSLSSDGASEAAQDAKAGNDQFGSAFNFGDLLLHLPSPDQMALVCDSSDDGCVNSTSVLSKDVGESDTLAHGKSSVEDDTFLDRIFTSMFFVNEKLDSMMQDIVGLCTPSSFVYRVLGYLNVQKLDKRRCSTQYAHLNLPSRECAFLSNRDEDISARLRDIGGRVDRLLVMLSNLSKLNQMTSLRMKSFRESKSSLEFVQDPSLRERKRELKSKIASTKMAIRDEVALSRMFIEGITGLTNVIGESSFYPTDDDGFLECSKKIASAYAKLESDNKEIFSRIDNIRKESEESTRRVEKMRAVERRGYEELSLESVRLRDEVGILTKKYIALLQEKRDTEARVNRLKEHGRRKMNIVKKQRRIIEIMRERIAESIRMKVECVKNRARHVKEEIESPRSTTSKIDLRRDYATYEGIINGILLVKR